MLQLGKDIVDRLTDTGFRLMERVSEALNGPDGAEPAFDPLVTP